MNAPAVPVSVGVIAGALKHRYRVRLIEHVGTQGPVWASRFADLYPEEFQGSKAAAIADAAHHARVLVRLEVLQIVSMTPGLRGPNRRIYGLKEPKGGIAIQVIQALRGKGLVLGSGGEQVMFALDVGEIVSLARAIGHSKRVAIVSEMHTAGELNSPVRWVRKFGGTLQSAAYHFRTLASLGVAPVVDTKENRGGKEHLHDLSGPLAAAAVAALDLIEGRARVVADPESRREPGRSDDGRR